MKPRAEEEEHEEDEQRPYADDVRLRVDDALTRAAEAEVAQTPYRAPSPVAASQPKSNSDGGLHDVYYRIRSKPAHFGLLFFGVVVGATLGALSAGIIALPFLVYIVWSRRRANAYATQINEASQALMAGDADGPAREYDRTMVGVKGRPNLHAVAVLNRALCFMRSGNLARARELYGRVYESGWLETGATNGHAASLLATCNALDGKIDEAREWLKLAKEKVTKPALLVFAEAVLAARSGDYDGAATIAETKWAEAETVGGSHGSRALRVIGAFARSRSGATEKGLEALVASVRPFRVGELDYLATNWPELRVFMEKHSLLN